MFIFERPFGAVAAALAVALLVVCLDRACEPPESRSDAAQAVVMQVRLVPRTPLGVSSPPVRDLSLSCRLPPAVTLRVGFRV